MQHDERRGRQLLRHGSRDGGAPEPGTSCRGSSESSVADTRRALDSRAVTSARSGTGLASGADDLANQGALPAYARR